VIAVTVPIVIAVVFPVFVIIPLSTSIPFVPVLKPAVFAFPVAIIVPSALIVRSEPSGPAIGRESPVTFVPFPVVSHGIPVTVNPDIIRTGRYRPNAFDTRRRRRSDLYAE
jgi:hypothetical protein